MKVKSKATLSNFKESENIANLIKQQAGWRFKLVVTNPKNIESKDREELSLTGVTKMLHMAEKLLESNYLEASFITVWSVL
ncbi:hypothetical protein [Bacillus cereus]|uniref:hypothetical protein n=1 Tax=Bacillus cereus TaxID=1396 RepID=UPI00148571D1